MRSRSIDANSIHLAQLLNRWTFTKFAIISSLFSEKHSAAIHSNNKKNMQKAKSKILFETRARRNRVIRVRTEKNKNSY